MIRCLALIDALLTFSTVLSPFFLLFSKHFEGIIIFSFGRFHSRDVPLVDICLHDMAILFLSIFHLSFQYTDQEKSPHPQSIELCEYRHCICFRYFTTCMFNCSKFASSNISKSPNFEKRLHIYKSRFEFE